MTARPEAAAPRRLPALDGIRAIAVFVVILDHSGALREVPADLGVTAFFVLSGYLITWLLIKELARTGRIDLRQFYIRRTLRIFPAYYTFIVLSLIADALLGHFWSIGLIASAFGYVMNYYNAFLGHPTTTVAHAWSLAVEEQFYLLWPLVLLTVWPKGSGFARNTLVLTILAVMIWRSVLYAGFHVQPSYVYNAFDARCDALAVGCLMAVCASLPAYRAFQSAVSRYSWLPLVTVGLIWLSRAQLGPTYHYTLGMSVDAILLAVFLIQMMRLSGTLLWSWLDASWIRWLGVISYPCYLWHAWGLSVGHHLVPHSHVWLQFLAGYAATLVLASGSYYIIERPFLALKSRFEASRAPQFG